MYRIYQKRQILQNVLGKYTANAVQIKSNQIRNIVDWIDPNSIILFKASCPNWPPPEGY